MQQGVTVSPVQTVSAAAIGYSTPVQFLPPSRNQAYGTSFGPGSYQPTVIVVLAAGASCTYSIEVTLDDVIAPGYVQSAGNWVAVSSATTNLTVSSIVSIFAVHTAARVHVTAGGSGTLNFQYGQLSA